MADPVQRLANGAIEAAETYLTAAVQSEEVRETLAYVGRVGANFKYARLRADELERPFVEMALDERKRDCFLRLVTIAARSRPEIESVVSDMLLHYASLLGVLEMLKGTQWTTGMSRAFARLQEAMLRDLVPAFIEVTKLCDAPDAIVEKEVVQRMDVLIRQTQRVIRLSVAFESLVPGAPARGRETASFFTESTGALLRYVAPIARGYWYIVNFVNPEMVVFIQNHFKIKFGSPAYFLSDLILKPLSPSVLARANEWYFFHKKMVQQEVTHQLMALSQWGLKVVAARLLAQDESFFQSWGATKDGARRFFLKLIPLESNATQETSLWNFVDEVGQWAERSIWLGLLWMVVYTLLIMLTAYVEERAVREVVSRATALIRGPPGLIESGSRQYQCINGVCVRLFPGDRGQEGADTFASLRECADSCRLRRLPRPNLLLRGRPDTAL